MLSLEKFKQLMPKDREHSDEEVIKLKENMEGMAELFFDVWIEDKKIKTNKS